VEEKCGSSVAVVHVIPVPPAMHGDNPPPNFLEHLEVMGREILRKAEDVAENKSLVITIVMLERADADLRRVYWRCNWWYLE
jgi:hypothetical protein